VRQRHSSEPRPGRGVPGQAISEKPPCAPAPADPGLRTHLALHLALDGTARPGEPAGWTAALGHDLLAPADGTGTLTGLLIHSLLLADETAAAEKIADDALTF
jgi:hypothetical protein